MMMMMMGVCKPQIAAPDLRQSCNVAPVPESVMVWCCLSSAACDCDLSTSAVLNDGFEQVPSGMSQLRNQVEGAEFFSGEV